MEWLNTVGVGHKCLSAHAFPSNVIMLWQPFWISWIYQAFRSFVLSIWKARKHLLSLLFPRKNLGALLDILINVHGRCLYWIVWKRVSWRNKTLLPRFRIVCFPKHTKCLGIFFISLTLAFLIKFSLQHWSCPLLTAYVFKRQAYCIYIVW